MSSKGTSTFIMQRTTAAIMAPLVLWFLFSFIANAGASAEEAKAFLAHPINALLLGVFVTTGALHMRIGMMEIIEDYIHDGLNGVLNGLNWAAAIAVIVATWWALITLAF